MQTLRRTSLKATPGAAVNQLDQQAGHVMDAQHSVDNRDTVKNIKTQIFSSTVS